MRKFWFQFFVFEFEFVVLFVMDVVLLVGGPLQLTAKGPGPVHYLYLGDLARIRSYRPVHDAQQHNHAIDTSCTECLL